MVGGQVGICEHRFVKYNQPVTMQQVARAAGVATSTVSKALRNDPSIPEKRCLSIQQAAARLGYRPNPMVSALMAQIHRHRRRSDPHNIAWIDLWPAGKNREVAMNSESILAGARMRAGELGYEIEVYPIGSNPMTPERLRRMLSSRGQWGLIIPPVPESAKKYPLDLRGLTGVTIGTSLHEPAMHRVSPNHFQGCVLAFEQMRVRKFHRVGLALTPAMNERVEGKWLGAFLACQQGIPKNERVSPLIAAADDYKSQSRWMVRENPDAILLAEEFPALAANPGSSQVPRCVNITRLMQREKINELGGLDWRPEQLGRVAVDMVVAQIHRNERGCPDVSHTVLIDAVWRHPASRAHKR